MKLKVIHLTLFFTGLIIAAGVCVYATLPWLVDAYISSAAVPLTDDGRKVILVLMYFVGIPVLTLLGIGFKMSLNILKGKAFDRENVRLLNIVSLCSIVSGVMFVIAGFFLSSVFPFVIFVIFLLLSLFSKIFANLFSSAIDYKEENELTI